MESFEADLNVSGIDGPVPAVFIRAPRFVRLGDDVEVLASCRGEAVLVREDHVLAATFHPELTDDDRLHRMFVDVVSGRHRQSGSAATRVAS